MWRIVRPDSYTVWGSGEVRKRLNWYYLVMRDEMPANFMIAKKIPLTREVEGLSLSALWKLHQELAKEFQTLKREVLKRGWEAIEDLEDPKQNFLDLKFKIAKEILHSCTFCERRCKVDRVRGEVGTCRLKTAAYVSSWFHHYGEEAPLVPSGTIFYGSCNFKCVFCIDGDDHLLFKSNGRIMVEKVKKVARLYREGNDVKVLTLHGWRKVVDVTSRITDEVYEIVTSKGKRVRLTPEHIVVVKDANKLREVLVKDLQVGDKLVTLPYNGLRKLVSNSKPSNKLKTINLIEEIDKLTSHSFKKDLRVRKAADTLRRLRSSYNISYREIGKRAGIRSFNYKWLSNDSIPFTEFTKMYRKYRELRREVRNFLLALSRGNSWIPAIIEINPRIMRLLGYFTANGNYCDDGLSLEFEISSEESQNDVLKCIKSLIRGNLNIKLKRESRRYKVVISNKMLYVLFKHVLGINSEESSLKLPWIIYNVDKELLKEYLTAYLSTCANKSLKNKGSPIRFVTPSESVAYGLAYILGLNNVQYKLRIKELSKKRTSNSVRRGILKEYWVEVASANSALSTVKSGEPSTNEYWREVVEEFLASKSTLRGEKVSKIRVIKGKRAVYDLVLEGDNDKLEEHVFFAGCGILIHNCQNHDISQERPFQGVVVNGEKLALIMKELRREGVRNINHVGGDPTPNLHVIVDGIRRLDVNVPQLWNSNMYCSLETMKLLREIIDIWLPDMKYGNDKCALRYSAAPKYWEVVTRNLKLAHAWGDIIIRHLVMPSHVECCTKPVLRWISENLPRSLVNIMEQYRPEHLVLRYPEKWPEIARRPSPKELREAYSYASSLGIVWEPVS